MNIGEWLPVTATSALPAEQSHHHRSSAADHSGEEYDFGFQVVRLMKGRGW